MEMRAHLAQSAVVSMVVHRLAVMQVHRGPLVEAQAAMLMLQAPDLLVEVQVVMQVHRDPSVEAQAEMLTLQAPGLLVEVQVLMQMLLEAQVATQALQALVRLASMAMPALTLAWPASWTESSHPQDRQLLTPPLKLLATARSLVKPSSTLSLN
jgi:hypothetical protein